MKINQINPDHYEVTHDFGKTVLKIAETQEEAEGYCDQHDDKILALAEYLDVGPEEIEEERSDDTYSYGREEYRVLDDAEADRAWEESIDSYIDDCVIGCIKDPETRKLMENYFDRDAFKRDCQYDGRGHSLSYYDGQENEQNNYYIYRTN